MSAVFCQNQTEALKLVKGDVKKQNKPIPEVLSTSNLTYKHTDTHKVGTLPQVDRVCQKISQINENICTW